MSGKKEGHARRKRNGLGRDSDGARGLARGRAGTDMDGVRREGKVTETSEGRYKNGREEWRGERRQ